jgi:hypothetical protein
MGKGALRNDIVCVFVRNDGWFYHRWNLILVWLEKDERGQCSQLVYTER